MTEVGERFSLLDPAGGNSIFINVDQLRNPIPYLIMSLIAQSSNQGEGKKKLKLGRAVNFEMKSWVAFLPKKESHNPQPTTPIERVGPAPTAARPALKVPVTDSCYRIW